MEVTRLQEEQVQREEMFEVQKSKEEQVMRKARQDRKRLTQLERSPQVLGWIAEQEHKEQEWLQRTASQEAKLEAQRMEIDAKMEQLAIDEKKRLTLVLDGAKELSRQREDDDRAKEEL